MFSLSLCLVSFLDLKDKDIPETEVEQTRQRTKMEMVDFQHYAESFSSPRPVRRQRNSVSNNSFSNLFGEGLLDLECDDYAILEDMAGSR